MWDKHIKEIYEMLQTKEEGLTQKEAENRLKLNGKNVIPKGKKRTLWDIAIEQFKSPIVFILVVAAIFSLITRKLCRLYFYFCSYFY